jgi:hypothetical protein
MELTTTKRRGRGRERVERELEEEEEEEEPKGDMVRASLLAKTVRRHSDLQPFVLWPG